MKPSELFGVMVRSMGLVVLSALWILFWAGVASTFEATKPFAAMLVFGIPVLFLGVWLIGGGGAAIVSLAYPEDTQKKADDTPHSAT